MDVETIRELIVATNQDVRSCLNTIQMAASNCKVGPSGDRLMIYDSLFTKDGRLLFHKDMEESIFDTLD